MTYLYRKSAAILFIVMLSLTSLCGILLAKRMDDAKNSSRCIRSIRSHIPVTPYDAAINACAAEYRLDPLLLKAMIAVESQFNDHCVSPVGASGLMQLMPCTARRLAVTNIFDPKDNIRGGARHLRYLLDRFKNDLHKSLAAYNAGEMPVIRYGGIPPYPETQKYVHNVLKIYKSYQS
jgi:soluble lytic murein transglycosylase-like protein